MISSQLHALLRGGLSEDRITQVFEQIEVPPELLRPASASDTVSRAELAFALSMALFSDLVERVPAACEYVRSDVVAHGRRVVFDHGALRTVRWPSGALPAGEAAFTRILVPLGYRHLGTYPLPRLKMTGRSYCHEDLPEGMAQYFLSELHPEQFSPAFQAAVSRVIGSSIDPLRPTDLADLAQLERDRVLPFAQAQRLLPALMRCFGRQHGFFTLDDYELLRAESSEMAWISTEGNAFNHATDRVADVEVVARRQRVLGRPIKDKIEVSASGRVRQTAFRAADVSREFLAGAELVKREVPGSFYEFISRDVLPGGSGQERRLDLGFDSGNATGIFGMTSGAQGG